MKFAYYETGTIPTHAYKEVPSDRTPEGTVREVGGERARLVMIFTSEDEARVRLAQDMDPSGGALGKGERL